MPLIYTGQETGLNRAFEFFKKDEAPAWEPRNEFFTFYKKLNELKHGQAALKAGTAGGEIVRYATVSNDLYIFSRSAEGSTVITFVNLGNTEQPVEYTGEAPAGADKMANFFTGATEEFPTSLKPGEYKVYVLK